MTEDSNLQETLPVYAVKKGVVLGMISCILVILIYIIEYKLLAQFTTSLVILAIFLGLVSYFGIDYRRSGSGFLSYGKAFQMGFIMLLTSSVITSIFNLVLYNLIDPELPGLLTESVIANTESMLRSWGLDQNEIDRQVAQMEKDIPQQFTVAGVLRSSWMFLLSSAFLAAIAGAIIKKNEPIIKG